MPHSKDMMFYYTSLFSQDLSHLEPILQITSCMNPEDAELIGLCKAMEFRLTRKKSERAKRFSEDIIPMLEIMAMSKWMKGEVTHLGLRLGHRNKRRISAKSDMEEDLEDDSPPINP